MSWCKITGEKGGIKMGEKIRVNQRKADGDEKHAPFGTSKSNTTSAYDSPFSEILDLQRTIGNRAVTRLIQSGVLQAKLKIGQPDDMYEKEADRVAEQVVRMTEECPECLEEEEIIQTKPVSGSTFEVKPEIESRIQSLKGSGQPLSSSSRNFFEPRFGVDFSRVRVQQNTKAEETTASLGARAFTQGNDIWLGQGESTSDKRLMAHELTHVVQQGGMSSSSNYINCDNGGASPPGTCGPDITQVIITHLNDVVSQGQGDLSWIWVTGARELQGYARRNGPRIRSAAASVSGCPSDGDCGGSYTVGGHCISGYHIDHILIMSYIEASYGALTARSAGQYNESFWLGALTEGFWFAGSSEAIANADLTFNEVAICLGEHMAHAEESSENVTDLLTSEEVRECFEGADMSAIGAKPSTTDSTAYTDCTPCSIPAPMPGDLELPPIDL
jgi:hypothetical protein